MKTCALLILFMAMPVQASELYADVGIGHLWGSALAVPQEPVPPGVPPIYAPSGPHAVVEVGYDFGRLSLFVMHTSSLSSGRDSGLNLAGAKYRFSVKLP